MTQRERSAVFINFATLHLISLYFVISLARVDSSYNVLSLKCMNGGIIG